MKKLFKLFGKNAKKTSNKEEEERIIQLLDTREVVGVELAFTLCKSLESYPKEIGYRLRHYWHLCLRYNLEAEEIRTKTQLEIIYGRFEFLPKEIIQLPELSQVALRFNKKLNLTDAFRTLSASPKLQQLTLLKNPVSSLPAAIGGLKQLKKLHIEQCSVENLPPEIGNLDKLTELDLQKNKLTALPPQIGLLKNLQKLDLSKNSIAQLPEQIGLLKNLRFLSLRNNSIKDIHEVMGYLSSCKQLTDLDLSNLALEELPRTIGALRNLKTLDLGFNQIVTFPTQLKQLKKLETLWLHGLKDFHYSEEAKETLQALLPQCKIYYHWYTENGIV